MIWENECMYVHKSSYQSSAEAVKFEETLVLLPDS